MKAHVRAASTTGTGVSAAQAERNCGWPPGRLAPASAPPDEGPHAESLGRLARLLAAHAPYDGLFPLRAPGLHVVRRSRPGREMVRATVPPALCIVAQGAKTVMLGARSTPTTPRA